MIKPIIQARDNGKFFTHIDSVSPGGTIVVWLGTTDYDTIAEAQDSLQHHLEDLAALNNAPERDASVPVTYLDADGNEITPDA